MNKLSFRIALLLGPLAYAIHHAEEHLLFNFREWRLSYFPDNNGLSTEAIFVLLTGVSLVYIISYHLLGTKTAGRMAILFAMMSQVANAIFHLGGTIVFWDFSPGLITALIVYVPVNIALMRAAELESVANRSQLGLLFGLGASLFAAFEVFGPAPLALFVIGSWAWTWYSAAKNSSAPTLPGESAEMDTAGTTPELDDQAIQPGSEGAFAS